MSRRAPNPNLRIFAFVLIVAGLVFGLAAIWKQLPIMPIKRVEVPKAVEPIKPLPPPSTDPAKLACDTAGGKWVECGSPCHGSPPGTACIQVCEPQCLCGGAEGWTCPIDLSCQSKDANGIGVCRAMAASNQQPLTANPKPAGMMCDETNSICVNTSYQNILLSSPFSVTGTAVAFEQQFAWRLEDGNGQKLEEGFTMTNATDTGERGPFTIRAFILEVPKTATGTLVLYEPSPKDGSETHVVRISVRLPQEKMQVKIFRMTGLHEYECGDIEEEPLVRDVVRSKFPIEASLQRLLVDQRGDGPDVPKRGYFSAGTRIISFTLANGIATVVFSRELADIHGCLAKEIRTEILATLKQFPSVKSIVIAVEGKTPEETLQP